MELEALDQAMIDGKRAYLCRFIMASSPNSRVSQSVTSEHKMTSAPISRPGHIALRSLNIAITETIAAHINCAGKHHHNSPDDGSIVDALYLM